MRMIDAYTHCPICGSADFEKSPHNTRLCGGCGHQDFNNPITAVAALISDASGNLLLIRRAKPPSQGKLAFPGGFVDVGETLEHAVTREIAEEIGLAVTRYQYLTSFPNEYLYRGVTRSVCDAFFVVEVVNFDVVLQQDEVAGWCQVAPAKLNPEDLAFDSMRHALQEYQKRALRG